MRYLCHIATAALLALSFFSAGCSKEPATAESAVTIPEGEKDPAAWGRKYPNHYDSYLRNTEASTGYSKYRGDRQDRLSPWPFQFLLFDGWGMAAEYNEPNGHTETVKDQLNIDPSRRKAGGVCLTCKTPYAPELKERLQGDYFRKPYGEVHAAIPGKHRQLGIACIDCHDPGTMDLRLSRWPLIEALRSMGKDPDRLTRQELRSLVCAQCHVTYAIPKDRSGASTGLKLPWARAGWEKITIESVISQIKGEGLREWTHKLTGQRLGHVRHPEFELFSAAGSIHWAAGVSCADCHMPYERVGREKISSHRWESPLKKNMRACLQCHNQSPEWLRTQVIAIQDRVNHIFTTAGYTLARAALLIEAAGKEKKADVALLKKARETYEEAYYRNTWVGAENSMGFHNPSEAMRVLADALDLGHRAEALALEALLRAGITPPALDNNRIDSLVSERYGSKDLKTGFRPALQRKAGLVASVTPAGNNP